MPEYKKRKSNILVSRNMLAYYRSVNSLKLIAAIIIQVGETYLNAICYCRIENLKSLTVVVNATVSYIYEVEVHVGAVKML